VKPREATNEIDRLGYIIGKSLRIRCGIAHLPIDLIEKNPGLVRLARVEHTTSPVLCHTAYVY
jgi:hypothetical protein